MKDATQREKNVMADVIGDLKTGFEKHHITVVGKPWWCSNQHLRVRARRVASIVMGRNYADENIQVKVPGRVGCLYDAAVDYRCDEFTVTVMVPDTYPRDHRGIEFGHFFTR